jgi:hypothetical protein
MVRVRRVVRAAAAAVVQFTRQFDPLKTVR